MRTREPVPGGRGPRRTDDALTPRERLVIELGARGMSTTQSARYMGVSMKTCKAQRASAYRRLGVGTMTQAVVLLIERGEIVVGQGDAR